MSRKQFGPVAKRPIACRPATSAKVCTVGSRDGIFNAINLCPSSNSVHLQRPEPSNQRDGRKIQHSSGSQTLQSQPRRRYCAALPIAVCSNSADEDQPFNTGFPSGRNIRYHLPSDCRSHPTTNSRFGCKLLASGRHVELTWARTCLCPVHVTSTMRHRFLPMVGMRISPSSDSTGGTSRDDRITVAST